MNYHRQKVSSESRSAEKPLQEQPQKVLSNKFITISYVTIHCLKLTILLWFTRSHGFLSNFSEQKQSQEFLFLVDFSQSVFNKKLCNPHVYVSVVMSALRLKSGMVWRQSAPLRGLARCIFSWFSIFQSHFVTNISSLAPVLTKFIKLTDAEPSLSCDPMQSSSLVLQSDIMLHQWHAALQWGARQSGSGKGSPSDLWSQVPVWQILCGDSGMGEQSFLAAAFNSLEPTHFLKSRPFYILNPRIHATCIKTVYNLNLIFLIMTIIYRLECTWQLAQL